MGDKGMSTHVLIEHGKAENQLEELQLTKSDKSKQRLSRTKASNQEIKRREQAKRIHEEQNQLLDVKKANTQEATGSKINDTLASHITSIMLQKPEEESEENLFQKILRPENCRGLPKITVNQVIWDQVSAEARTGDGRMQRVQSALVKGTTNVALIADLVLKSSEDKVNMLYID
ncbi:hypothetical protein P5673_018619 [Acropora cervicornis]|uniref:Uncharacterized protein n=1 Tax=Acropora cervicornis TaxID=6130 RepID=A0AAD9V2P8_ACRCE|nr:hypothetical protein P5673_018619 [Acropora cervicornis]